MANEAAEPTVPAIIEMLRRELDASKSVSDHLAFLRQVAQDQGVGADLREHLVTHVGEEEQEHQEHLARLVPALEQLAARLEGGPEPIETKAAPAPLGEGQLTVGSLIGKRPWFVGARPQ